jgi:hypothetical protein
VAEVTIRLIVDPTTKKKNVVISYRSDDDALPMEHEDAHREIVDKLIEGGALKAAELGKIIVDREGDHGALEVEGNEEGERESVKQKG